MNNRKIRLLGLTNDSADLWWSDLTWIWKCLFTFGMGECRECYDRRARHRVYIPRCYRGMSYLSTPLLQEPLDFGMREKNEC